MPETAKALFLYIFHSPDAKFAVTEATQPRLGVVPQRRVKPLDIFAGQNKREDQHQEAETVDGQMKMNAEARDPVPVHFVVPVLGNAR